MRGKQIITTQIRFQVTLMNGMNPSKIPFSQPIYKKRKGGIGTEELVPQLNPA
jgi:hypothetical protein